MILALLLAVQTQSVYLDRDGVIRWTGNRQEVTLL